MPLVGRDVRDEIEADRKFEVAGIEIYKVVGAMRRNAVEQFFREVAVREAILGKNDSAKRWLGTDSQLLGESLWRLGALLEESGRLAEAGPILGRALKTLIDTSKKLEYLHEEVERLVKYYRKLLLKMGDTEEQAQEKIDKMMEPLTKK